MFLQGTSAIHLRPGAGIADLPIEVFDIILEFLSIEDVVHAGMTCHRLRKVCEHTAFWHHRWRQLDVPQAIALCRPLHPAYEVIRARKMQLELRGQYSSTPHFRPIRHRLSPNNVTLLPGGRFLLVKSPEKHGHVLYYDLDEDVPVARPLLTYHAPKLPGLILASLCSSTQYEIALAIISAERRYPRYYDGEVDFFHLSLSADKSTLCVDSHSKIMINFGGSVVPTLQGTILLRERVRQNGSYFIVELIDLARSSDDQLFGTRFIPTGEHRPQELWLRSICSVRLLPPADVLIAYGVYVKKFPVPPFGILPPYVEGSRDIVSVLPTFTLHTSSTTPAVGYSSPFSLFTPNYDYFLVADGERVHAIRNDFFGVSRSSEVLGHTRLGNHSILHATLIEKQHALHVVAFKLQAWTTQGKSVVFGNKMRQPDLLTSGVIDIPLPTNRAPLGMIYDEWSGRVMFRTRGGKRGGDAKSDPDELHGGFVCDLTGPVTDVDFDYRC